MKNTIRRKRKSYTVKYFTSIKDKLVEVKETFTYLRGARKFAHGFIGQNVSITNINGIVIPL